MTGNLLKISSAYLAQVWRNCQTERLSLIDHRVIPAKVQTQSSAAVSFSSYTIYDHSLSATPPHFKYFAIYASGKGFIKLFSWSSTMLHILQDEVSHFPKLFAKNSW